VRKLRTDWTLVRALCEHFSRVDALDMTWVRFSRMAESMQVIIRAINNAPRTPEDEIDEQREGRIPTF
jgi:NADH:ubiquinone oxidoreductase subunit D